ncbi:MAG TPA: hypothetical protein DD635_09280 [Flavobacteriales bacterium]|nr:hypothetical protein [Flavobacteriales bacterium]|tara:strand:- start:161 stop:373 length:213 start_codon:yes stop_codon:yes gene_type:complete
MDVTSESMKAFLLSLSVATSLWQDPKSKKKAPAQIGQYNLVRIFTCCERVSFGALTPGSLLGRQATKIDV